MSHETHTKIREALNELLLQNYGRVYTILNELNERDGAKK
jgi:hypothetical protein